MTNLSRSLLVSTAVVVAFIGASTVGATVAPIPAPTPDAAPSFRCEAATTAVEKKICANPMLSESDAKLAASYELLLHRIPVQDQPALRDTQRTWLRDRDGGCESQEPNYTSCLASNYENRVKALEFALASPGPGLDDLLWTDGVACTGNRALVRFARDWDGRNDPPHVGGRLAHAPADLAQCRLSDGRLVRFKTAALHDEAAYGECGADTTTIYSVWIGDRKVISREVQADKCGANPIRAVFVDGNKLIRCSDERGFDGELSSRSCTDISRRLTRPVQDKLPLGRFVITFSAKNMRGFCEKMVWKGEDTGDADWPRETAYPRDEQKLEIDEVDGESDPDSPQKTADPSGARRADLDNSGHARPVIAVSGESHFFDGNFMMLAPRGMAAGAIASVVAKQSSDPDPQAARKLGFEVFAGDQTPYREPRYVRLTPFRKLGATWLHATWATTRLDLPSEVITRPMPNGTQRLICTYQAMPDL